MRLKHLLSGVAAGALMAFAAAGAHAQQQNQPSSQSAPPVSGPVSGTPSPSYGATSTAPANDVPYAPRTSEQMTMSDMQDRIEELQRQLDFMRQSLAEQTSTVVAVAKAPKATLANGRPGWASADGNFTAALNGVIQFDAGNYFQKNNLPAQITGAARDLNGGTDARRARFGFGGKAFGDFDYNFLYEFGGSGAEDAGHIQEAWFQYTGFLKPFHVRVGYFEPLIGMEANVSTNSIALLERASPAEVARGVAAGDFRSALQVFGNDTFKHEFEGGGKLGWLASGAVTGNTLGNINTAGAFQTQPFDEQLAVVGRGALNFSHGDDYTFHVGANAQYVIHPNDNTGIGSAIAGRYTIQLRDRPELRLDTTRLVDTGALNTKNIGVYGAEIGGQFKSFELQAEYFDYDIKGDGATATTSSPDFHGYYVEGSYVLTGEHRVYNAGNGAFNGPTVAHPFNWAAKTWGAFEIAARYSDLDLNYRQGVAGAATPAGGVRGGEQEVYSASLNWYLNPVVRFMIDGSHVDIDRLNAAGLRLNQSYDTVAIRSQFAF